MDLVKSGVKLMTDLFENMKNAKSNDLEVRTPKWLAPLILLFDLYEKSAIASKRRSDLAKVIIIIIEQPTIVCKQFFPNST